MNISAIRHRSAGSGCYALDADTVVLNLTTGCDVERAFAVCEDPFIHELNRKKIWEGEPHEMKRAFECEHNLVWSIELKPEYKRLQYYFIAEAKGERYCVFENKTCPESERDKISTEFFKFPWINPGDVIAPPKWVRDTVWYQIMPDRFARGSNFAGGKKFRKWGAFSNPGCNDFYGGNLKGITERLPYLKKLGISGLYLTPIFLSNTNHKYNTFDYRVIDPDFGTEEDLTELIEKAHSMGIRVMLDAVFNHCGTEFFAWRDVCEKGRDSEYFDWFFINKNKFLKHSFTTRDGRYYTFSFWSPMPKLNTNTPAVQRYFSELCVHWVRDFDVDGIRFDVGDEVSHSFIRRLNNDVKAAKPDVFLLGEIWSDSISWLNGYEYDSVMNYPFSGAVGDFWRCGDMTAHDFMHRLNFCRCLYPRQVNETLFNFLDTHDTARVRDTCANDDVLLQKLAVIFTCAGTPCLYYGTEIPLRGVKTPYNRGCMPWDEIESGVHDGFKSRLEKLIKVRSSFPETKKDEMEFVFDEAHPRLICYKKGKLSVYINAESESVKIPSDGEVVFDNNYEKTSLKKDGVLILRHK